MAKHQKKKHRGQSVQDLIGIRRFSKYGLLTNKGEMIFFLVSPTNISVLSKENIEIKISQLTEILSLYTSMEIVCTDASECFDSNKLYLQSRLNEEKNPGVRELLAEDIDYLDNIQMEMATARQFVFAIHTKSLKDSQTFDMINDILKRIADAKFECRRMTKSDIKRFLALYFGTSAFGDRLPDVDGAQYYNPAKSKKAKGAQGECLDSRKRN